MRLPAQVKEHRLRHILCAMVIATDQAKRRRINKIDITRNQLTERFFRPTLDKLDE
jgi:hypothetical protein